jgi:hypothetical protein
MIQLGVHMSQAVMHPIELALRLLWSGAILAHFVLAVRLWQTGLARVYRGFFWYLGFRVARALVLQALPYQYSAYGYFWAATEPLLWFFYILIVLEVYSLVLQKYKGIAKLGRWAVVVSLLASLAISALTLGTDLLKGAEQYPLLRIFFIIERGVVTSLLLFILFITAFLVWYPVPLARNTVVHCLVFAIYFLSTTMAILVRNLFGTEVINSVNLALSAISVVCLLLWTFLLNQRGENAQVSVRQKWAPEDEAQIMEQLTAINATLLRIARK